MSRTSRMLAAITAAVLIAALAPTATAGGLKAELIDVHEIRVANHGKGGNGGGPPDGKGPPGGGGGDGGGTSNCTNDDSSQYTGATVPTGWLVQGPRTAHLNPATVPSSLGDVTTTMQSSFNAWSGGGVPAITVATDGTLTREKANRQYDILFGRAGGGTIAVTYTWRWSDGMIESDVVFNSKLSWFKASSEGDGCVEDAGNVYDVGNIATHEFGHVYGLDHPSGARFESMYAYGFTGETLKRSPTPGERSGLAAMY